VVASFQDRAKFDHAVGVAMSDVERLDDDPFAMTAEEWEMVQRYRWEYRDGTPYTPQRQDTYWEGRDAIAAPEGWAYRIEETT
jgi:hypothetical protein